MKKCTVEFEHFFMLWLVMHPEMFKDNELQQMMRKLTLADDKLSEAGINSRDFMKILPISAADEPTACLGCWIYGTNKTRSQYLVSQ